jgi:putative copper resistance protein D
VTDTIDVGVAIARFFTYALAMFAFGWAVFDTAIARKDADARPLRTVTGAGLAIAALAYLTLLAREASGASGAPPPSLVAALAVTTGFGRALLATAFAGLQLALWAQPPRHWRVALAGVGLAALAFVGHAADGEGWIGGVRLAVMTLHLIAVGAWLGALPGLYLALKARDETARRLLRRFGVLGAAAVSLVLASGLASLAFVAAEAHWRLGTAYLGVLLAKLAVVVGLLIIAWVNRFRLTPRVKTDAAAALAALRRSILIEQGLAVLAVAAVAVLGQLDPTM